MAVAVREINGNVSMTDPVHGRQTFTLTRAGARHPVKSVTQRGIRPRDFLRLAVRRYFADLHARATQQLADLQARAAAMSMAMNAEASATDPRDKESFHGDEYWACVGNKVFVEHFVPYVIGLGLVYGGPHPGLKLIGGIGVVALGAKDAQDCRDQATHPIRY